MKYASALIALLAGCVHATPRPALDPAGRSAIVAAASATPATTSVVILVDGERVLEHYGPGITAQTLHDTRSVGKSVTALAFGAALERGAIRGVDEPVRAAWPVFAGAPSAGLTYRDLLTMRSALDCDDSVPESPGNEDRMHEQTDWTAWALALPLRDAPDAADAPLRYCTVNAFLVGQAIAAKVGMRFDAFVDEALFLPLGITRRHWMTSPSDEVMTGGGLELASTDLAKLGELVRRRGEWEQRRLVPKAFLDDATTVHTSAGPDRGYGYFLWRYPFATAEGPQPAWFMAGNGGSIVAVFDELHAVVVITRTAYNTASAAGETMALVERSILPALLETRRTARVR